VSEHEVNSVFSLSAFVTKQWLFGLCMFPQVKIVRESDHKLVLTNHGDGFNSVTTFEVSGNSLTLVSILLNYNISCVPFCRITIPVITLIIITCTCLN